MRGEEGGCRCWTLEPEGGRQAKLEMDAGGWRRRWRRGVGRRRWRRELGGDARGGSRATTLAGPGGEDGDGRQR
jgi:hypothetical protein